MKILTTLKKVVDVELTINVKDGAIVEDGLQYVMNAWDENAIEASVQLKENNKADTTVVAIGTGDHAELIRKAYAMGIEKGIHVDDPAISGADSFTYARVLQAVFEKGDFDVVIVGKQAQDTDNGQTGIILAECLGLPCVSNVAAITVVDDKTLSVSRLGDTGTENLTVSLPAVITVSDSINEPRLPQMRGIMMAKKKSIETKKLADLGLSADDVAHPKSTVTAFMATESRKSGKKFEGPAAEITAKVVGLLATEASVL